MHQSYDGEEEFEPRIIPKPTAKLDCFAVPTVPEISLVFEKPMVQNLNDRCTDSSPIRLLKSIRVLDNINNTTECINSTSSISYNPNSYAAWREQNYTREANSRNTMHFSPLRKNTHSCNYALQSDASIQKQQEQNKICDMQKQVVNVKTNDGIYEKCVKFTCPDDVDNSYNHRGDTHSLPASKSYLSCNTVQKAKFSVPDHSMRMPNKGIPDTLKGTEHLQMPYTGYQQFHASNHSNYNVDNNETVKTLLQLVNSQSEQIKNLQLQIDRLIRMQEESFRNKSTCSCSSALANQVLKYPLINCYDTALSSSLAQSQNKDMKKNEAIQNTSAIEKKDLNILGENNKLETALLEQQPKKTFVEQKVSIGVMTSFEFTVQNSPFLLDSEIYEKKEVCRESNNINRRNAVNVQDTTEPVKRYKNTFTHKTGAAQLENIVEDSESYLSSNQQQSSNFNVSSSMRDSERHTLKESDICNTANTSESSKKYQYLATDLNQKEMHKRMYTMEDDNTNEQVHNIRKMFDASMNVECSPSASMTCNKMLVNNENDYISINREKNVANVNANKHSLHNIHLPVTDYYQNHRNKKHGTNTKQIQDVGDSMILSGGNLKINERPPPTPEPSIHHLDMQEYTSDDESDKKHTPEIGWTFYDNVLGQVNEILQNSSVMNDKNQNNAKIIRKVEQENDMETKTALNNVKVATLEQLRKLGISLTENKEYRESNCDNKMLDFDSSFYPHLDRQANMMHSVVNETNTSMHMKALALKYLSDEQLADIALHKEESSSLKHLMVSNMQGTNMSLATMRYLERYKILPGKNDMQVENTDQTYGEMASKHDFKPTTGKNNPTLRQLPFVQTPGTTCPSRILDLSTLKRQPKLL